MHFFGEAINQSLQELKVVEKYLVGFHHVDPFQRAGSAYTSNDATNISFCGMSQQYDSC
jgi:hypothetical protein